MRDHILPLPFCDPTKKRALEEMQSDTEDDLSSYVDAPTVTMDMHISESNVGYRMLQKMGWKAGQGLGASSQGTYRKHCFLPASPFSGM